MTLGGIEAAPDGTAKLFTEVKRSRSSDDVVAQVKDAIIAGHLKAGDRLPNERELCGVFGVSRPTLREGLRTLEVLGVIEIRPGAAGGIFVSEPQGDHLGAALGALLRFRHATVHDLAEFRVSFEAETARWAARRADADDVSRLTDLAHRFSELSKDKALPWRVLVEIDVAFHEALAEASKNAVHVGIMLGIQRALHEASSSLDEYASPRVRKRIGTELRQIAAAVAAHDATRAARLTRAHVKKFSQLEREVHETRG
ncbi:MAG TPA: FCD domain-containing protein [Gaiellaceae bacterium]|nr:FCD domain-containing protein [Gaiellaceae bacterium]